MIYELRTYWAAPGKAEALNARFRDLTMGLFARHQIQSVAYWTPEGEAETHGDLIYLLAFPSREHADAAWKAFRADPDWQAGKAASEVDGLLVSRLTSLFLQPTDYSPMQ